MEIKDFNINSITWASFAYGPLADICVKIKEMKEGTAIEVKLDRPMPGFRASMYGRIKRMDLRCKIQLRPLDDSKQKWAIAKFAIEPKGRKK